MSVVVQNARNRIRTVTAHTQLFSAWPAPLIDKLIHGAEMRSYSDREPALRSGSVPEHLCLVASGYFICERPLHSGDTMIMDYLMPGQATSHLAVFDGLPATFNILASGRAEMIFIPRKSLLDALGSDPHRWSDVVLMLCRRLRAEYETVYMRTANSLRCQLAKTILYWARGHWDENSKGVRLPLSISQENIAAMLGRSRPTINKEIGAFIANGVLARSYRQVEILDVKALMNIIEQEDPGWLKAVEPLFARQTRLLGGPD